MPLDDIGAEVLWAEVLTSESPVICEWAYAVAAGQDAATSEPGVETTFLWVFVRVCLEPAAFSLVMPVAICT